MSAFDIKKWFLILLLSVFAGQPLFAAGRYAGASMELGVGARPLAIGGAAVAMGGSAELFHYNPASLAMVTHPTVSMMYAPTFNTISSPLADYHFVGFAYPLPGGGTVALNWTRFAVDDIPIYPDPRGSSYADRNTDKNLQPDGIAQGYFNDVEDVYYISFAKDFKKNLPLGWLYDDALVEIPFGMNFKILRQSLYTANASGMGIDIGFMVRTDLAKVFEEDFLGKFAFGMSLLDVTQTSIIWNTESAAEDRVRRTKNLGVYYGQPMWFSDARLNLYWNRRSKYDQTALYGLEFAMRGMALRVGHNGYGMTSGAGLKFWRLIVDYAFVSNELDDVHRISCAVLLK